MSSYLGKSVDVSCVVLLMVLLREEKRYLHSRVTVPTYLLYTGLTGW